MSKTKPQSRQKFYRNLLLFLITTSFSGGLILYDVGIKFSRSILLLLSSGLLVISITTVLVYIALWFVRYEGYKGIYYAIKHSILVHSLEKQFIDAGFFSTTNFGATALAVVPWITIKFSDDLKSGTVFIRNSIKFDKKLDVVNISSALKGYVVEQVYLSTDQNHYYFEFFDASIYRRLIFNSYEEFKHYSNKFGSYEFFIDKFTQIPLHQSLIVGQTGSGKSYALFCLVLQMISKQQINYNLYFADPKGSSIALLGKQITPDTTAIKLDEIITLLEVFIAKMQERKLIMEENLKSKLDGDYRDFKLEPHIFIFDEYASFSSILQTQEKKKRDHVNSMLSEIIQEGRQLGFFCWLCMQQASGAAFGSMGTSIRENLPFKIVLSNAEPQTYVTAFGNGVDIPEHKFDIGEGIFTYPQLAPKPKVCSFSTLNFDILEAVRGASGGTVSTPAPENHKE